MKIDSWKLYKAKKKKYKIDMSNILLLLSDFNGSGLIVTPKQHLNSMNKWLY